MLPKLHTVYLIVGLSEVGQQAELVEALRAEAAALGRPLRVDGNPVTIQAQQVTDSDQEALVDFLRPFSEQAGAWVDITGGTKTMSIAVARAAGVAGVRTMYTATEIVNGAPVFHGIVEAQA